MCPRARPAGLWEHANRAVRPHPRQQLLREPLARRQQPLREPLAPQRPHRLNSSRLPQRLLACSLAAQREAPHPPCSRTRRNLVRRAATPSATAPRGGPPRALLSVCARALRHSAPGPPTREPPRRQRQAPPQRRSSRCRSDRAAAGARCRARAAAALPARCPRDRPPQPVHRRHRHELRRCQAAAAAAAATAAAPHRRSAAAAAAAAELQQLQQLQPPPPRLRRFA
jgi:hypothetical protein